MSIFDEGFEEPKESFPDSVIKEIARDFYKATNNLARLDILDLTQRRAGFGELATDFAFKLILNSEYLPGYSFKVFEFGYDVSIYPVHLLLEDSIAEELGYEKDFGDDTFYASAAGEEDFEKLLGAIFKSSAFKTTVGGLMKIARSKRKEP